MLIMYVWSMLKFSSLTFSSKYGVEIFPEVAYVDIDFSQDILGKFHSDKILEQNYEK